MSSFYGVHAASVGKAAMRASRGSIDGALREAKLLLRSGYDFVWIDDGKGNVILPAAEVRARVDGSFGKDGRRRPSKTAVCVYRAVSPFDRYLAERSVSDAGQSSDARFRFFLIDLAATQCDLAREFLDGAATGRERPPEAAKIVADGDSVDPRNAATFEGLDPWMIPGLKPRIVH